jgi:pimeloyl-ACP methyl ester carboxylesterase/putative sterol carrier protein
VTSKPVRLEAFMELPSPLDRVAKGLERRIDLGSPLPDGVHATVVFDVGHTAWSLVIDGSRMDLVPGRSAAYSALIRADTATLAAMLAGEESGVDAFLDGRLSMRGNLALGLKLDGVDAPERPIRFSRARTVDAGGIETFYLEAGQGPPVVLLHGLGATNASMLPTLSALAADHRVLAPDLPGFGDSAKPTVEYGPPFFATWLQEFLDAVGVGSAILVGNSMGGRIAIETALVAPARVERLVLFAPSLAFKRFREATPVVRLLSAQVGALPLMIPRSIVMASLRIMFARPERLRDAWYDGAADEFARVFATSRGRTALFSATQQIYCEEAHGESGFWDRIGAVRCPALFLWGDCDQLVPARFARHVTEALPHARSMILDDCGHVPQFEHAAKTHRLVREFLAA